jgi:hypothetical protein
MPQAEVDRLDGKSADLQFAGMSGENLAKANPERHGPFNLRVLF